MGDLLPCPFCGSRARTELRPDRGHVAMCVERFSGCPANARTHHCATAEEAVVAWNRRASAARMAELEAANARLREALEPITAIAEDWCHAVSEDASWDSWDHHYKTMKWSDILPRARRALGESTR